MKRNDQHQEEKAGESVSMDHLAPSDPLIATGERATVLPVPSAARLKSERLEVEQGVRLLVERRQSDILAGVGRALLYAALPIIVFVAVRQAILGGGGWLLWWEAAALALATVGARSEKMPVRVRALLVTGGFTIAAMMSLLYFGPLIGAGFVFVASAFFAALLLPAREAYLCAAVLCVEMYVCTYLSSTGHGALRTEFAATFEQWLRLSVTTTVSLFTLLYIFLKVHSSLWSSLENQIRLRIRERKFVEERERMVRTAGSVQRLESLGRLAGGIAHDLNNSLVVIQCGLFAIEDGLGAEERKQVLAEVHAGVGRAAATARQLLSFAKRNVEELGACDPKVVCERICKEGGRLLPANVRLRLVKPESQQVPRVGLSEAAVEQLLLTLIQNARDALGDRAGTISIEMAESHDTGGLVLKVSDDGPGMSADIREQAWEPFFTTKGEHHAGLGLSTVWATMRRHGGEAQLETEEGKGTAVSMMFPPAAFDQLSADNQRAEVVSSAPSDRVVLVLEDDASIRAALRRVLKHTGLEVVEAEAVAEAREKMGQRRYALLVSDGVLPDGGVGEFILDFIATQSAPVILCSGYLEEDLALEGVARGQCSFLPKPFTPEELTTLVGSLLSEGSAQSGPQAAQSEAAHSEAAHSDAAHSDAAHSDAAPKDDLETAPRAATRNG